MKLTRSGKKLLRGASRVTLTVKATFRSRAGGRISARSKVTLKRNPLPVPAAPIPANVTPLYGQTFDSRAPWSGLSTQCAHPIQWRTENGDGYAHFEVRPGEVVGLVGESARLPATSAVRSATAASATPPRPGSTGTAPVSAPVPASPRHRARTTG